MVLFNILFFLFGLALVGLGIYVMVDPSLQKLKEVLPTSSGVDKGLSYLEIVAIVIIVVGAILVIIGFLGCCGAMKQVKAFLIIYAVIIGLLILAEVALAIYVLAFKSKFEDDVIPKLQDTVRTTYEGPLGLIGNSNQSKPSAASLAWDFVMYNYQCCGVRNREDFNGTVKWNRTNPWWEPRMPADLKYFAYPLTCCKFPNVFTRNWKEIPADQLQAVALCAITGDGTYKDGCYSKVMDVISTAKTWIIVGVVAVLLIELAAFITALVFFCRKRKDAIYYSS